MKVTNRDEFKNFLDYVQIRHSCVVEVGDKIGILLLQGRLQHRHFLFFEKEHSQGIWKDNVASTERFLYLLNRKGEIIFKGVEEPRY